MNQAFNQCVNLLAYFLTMKKLQKMKNLFGCVMELVWNRKQEMLLRQCFLTTDRKDWMNLLYQIKIFKKFKQKHYYFIDLTFELFHLRKQVINYFGFYRILNYIYLMNVAI